MNNSNQSRRDFFKQALGVAGLALMAPTLVRSVFTSVAQAADAPKFVAPGKGMAASVNYLEDKKKAPKNLQIERNGVPFAKQSCSGCALYTKDAVGNYGKCALFPNENVKPTSWCQSWSKKA